MYIMEHVMCNATRRKTPRRTVMTLNDIKNYLWIDSHLRQIPLRWNQREPWLPKNHPDFKLVPRVNVLSSEKATNGSPSWEGFPVDSDSKSSDKSKSLEEDVLPPLQDALIHFGPPDTQSLLQNCFQPYTDCQTSHRDKGNPIEDIKCPDCIAGFLNSFVPPFHV